LWFCFSSEQVVATAFHELSGWLETAKLFFIPRGVWQKNANSLFFHDVLLLDEPSQLSLRTLCHLLVWRFRGCTWLGNAWFAGALRSFGKSFKIFAKTDSQQHAHLRLSRKIPMKEWTVKEN
jgi:hypothetical protein